MTTAEAAQRLRVSQRQIQRLIHTGEVSARRTAGDSWVLDALAVNSLARSRPSRGRPWSAEAAWGALWMISGLEARWLDDRTRSRLSSRLRTTDAEEVVHACRRRAEVRRCRVSDSFLDELREELTLTGASAAEQFGLAGELSRVEGYCDETAWDAIRSRFRLVDDSGGNATVRVTTFVEVLEGGRAAMPAAVAAADLAESYEVRERAAGLRALEALLGE